MIGTVNYLAPEIARGEVATISSDIYAVGLILWEMLMGTTPFKSAIIGETLKRINDESLIWPDAIVEIAPIGFTKLVSRMTSKDPAKRPSSAQEIVDELEIIQSKATWEGSFGRESRFDLNINWSNETIESLYELSIADAELPFVLQMFEDHLSRESDARLTSTQPIKVEPGVISVCVSTYHLNRKNAAQARQVLLKTQLVAAQPISVRTKNNMQKLIAPIRSPSTVPKAKSPLLGILQRFATALIVIAFFAGATKMFVTHIQNRIRMVSDDATPIAPQNPTSNFAQIPTRMGVGTRLFYRIHDSGSANSPQQEIRILDSSTDGKSKWVVNNAYSVDLPAEIFSHEAFFDPAMRLHSGQPIIKSLNSAIPIQMGDTVTEQEPAKIFQVSNQDATISEDVTCLAVDKKPRSVGTRTEDVWHIVCDRKTSQSMNGATAITRKIREDYLVSAETGLMIKATLSTTSPTQEQDLRQPASRGSQAPATVRTIELDFDLSSEIAIR